MLIAVLIDAKLIFVTTATNGTGCVLKGAHLKLDILFSDFAGFFFDQQSRGIPRILRNLQLLLFFIDCSIADAKLVFIPSNIFCVD